MIVLLHVLIALTSIGFTTYLYCRPSKRKFYASYSLIAATLASGTYLVISTHAPMLSSCTTGLLYLGIICCIMVPAHIKLAADEKNG